MEGTELIKQFHLINPGTKKIMVTGYATLENAIKSLNWGADGYLQKPVPPTKLLSFVADKLMEQEVENDLNEDIVIDLLRAKKQDEQNLDRWT